MKNVLGFIWLLVVVFCLFGCKTIRQTEHSSSVEVKKDSVKQTIVQLETRYDSIYLHDSTFVEYRIGRTDTLNLLRVDTLYRYKERIAYRAQNAAKTKADTLFKVLTDTLYITNTKTNTIEKAAKVSLWQRLKYFLLDALVALIVFLLVKYIKGK